MKLIAKLTVIAAISCATTKPMATSEGSFIEGRAGKLHVLDGGSGGVPVVFLHGLCSSADAWRDALVHARKKRRAIAYDQRGHGESDAPRDSVYTIAALADDLDAVVSRLGVSKFVLIGHSFSGTVLTTYAARHPGNVAKLIYVDAAGDLSDAAPEMKARFIKVGTEPGFGPEGLRAVFAAMLGPYAKPTTRERVLDGAARTDVAAFTSLRRSMASYAARLDAKKFEGPKVAIETADNGGTFSASYAFHLPRRTLANVSHWLMMDDPEGFNALLDELLP